MNAVVIVAVLVAGFAVGLRTFTAAAVISWAAHLGFINLSSSPVSFMSSAIAVGILSLAALGEYVYDLLPSAEPRTAAPGLIARFVFGCFSAACLFGATGANLLLSILGGVTAIAGAFAGYQIRTRLGRSLGVKDAFIAIPEDVFAVGLSILAIFLL